MTRAAWGQNLQVIEGQDSRVEGLYLTGRGGGGPHANAIVAKAPIALKDLSLLLPRTSYERGAASCPKLLAAYASQCRPS